MKYLLCEYGCGNIATYFKLPPPKVPNGRYSCSPSPNSCPSKRSKTTGDKNPSKRQDVRDGISKTNRILFASGSELRKKCNDTLMKKYGVDNAARVPGAADKVVVKRKKNKSYYYQSAMNEPDANKKRKDTRLKLGLDIPDHFKEPFQLYEKMIDKMTEISYSLYKEIINPMDLQRGRVKGSYQLDHIFSKVDGFNKKIPPEIISHPANLRMLSIRENISKSSTSHYSKEELLEAIEKFSLNKNEVTYYENT